MANPYGVYNSWKDLIDYPGEIAAVIFSYVVFVVMFLSLIFTTVIMYRGFKNGELGETTDLSKKIGSFYEDIKTDSPYALLYTPIYILRRVLFCLFILVLEDYPIA
jgi:hypothetical protein